MDSDLENEEPLDFLENENGKRPLPVFPDTDKDLTLKSRPKRARRNLKDLLGDSDDDDDNREPVSRVPITVRVRYRRVLKHIPQDIPFLPITTETGSRVYLRILEKGSDAEFDHLEEDNVNLGEEPRKLTTTVGGSNRKLFFNWNSIKEEARALKANFHKTLGTIVDDDNIVKKLGNSNAELGNVDEVLWVEKYKPRSYMDLLSEESTNKALLHWMKLWDKSVFGIDYLLKVKMTKEKYSKLEAQDKEKLERIRSKFAFKSFKPPPSSTDDDEYDEAGRPKFKVALLHGPPGLGKTTCAHVVARQAGYSVREMNASDDRSVDIFRKVLDDALQSRTETFQFQNGKPNCLIIDEIDGAPTATVSVLVELITGNATEKGKRKLKKVLKRPIICICNDPFAPSLKELKKHALILQFNPVSIPALSERLQDISLREELNLDSTTLQSLCAKSECDIRSCLSTLQFLKTKKCSPKDAIFSQIGMKDKAKGLFAVWTDIFTVPEEKKKAFEVEDSSKPDVRFKSVLKVVQSFGDYEKLLSGVFENYLRVKFRDCYFESIIEGLSWTSWFHDIQTSVESHQHWELMGYLPLYFVLCHFLYGQRSWFKVNFPSNDSYATQVKIVKIRSVISTMIADVSPGIGRFLDPYSTVVDLFPSLATIIQPSTIRPIPTQIWSARERETLRNIVEVMIAYNLSFTQIKNPDTGAYQFLLEPDIESIGKFKLQDGQGAKKSFPYAVKQLVAREIETEKMRRSDAPLTDVQQDDTTPSVAVASSSSSPALQIGSKSPAGEFKLPQPVPSTSSKGKIDLTTLTAKDFFGRAVAPSAQNTQDLLAQQRRSSGIYFRFKEGYSNAVRKFVKMKDLE